MGHIFRRFKKSNVAFALFVFTFLIGCSSSESIEISQAVSDPALIRVASPVATITPIPTIPPPTGPTARPTITPTPTDTLTPTPTSTASPTITLTPSPTATRIACSKRIPNQDDLLSIVTQTFALSREFKPDDLVSLADYFEFRITRGYPTQVREIIIGPLAEMISDMRAAGLDPYIISGYRSYASQEEAYQKWLQEEPDRVAILSARPGHSEHQLGTTVDFGSYSLIDYIDDSFSPNTQFHTFFYKTPEGAWLLENAHNYGFTLSYPLEAFGITGFYYEPWHYRYVGVGNATVLHENRVSLTEYSLNQDPWPCIPD